MPIIRVLQVRKDFNREAIAWYRLDDFEGKKRGKTLLAIYGCRAPVAAPHVIAREVLSRIAPPDGYVWYKMLDNKGISKLHLYKDSDDST